MMIIKVEGKQRMTGTSKKTGNPYDFIVVHCLMKMPNVVGNAAVTKNISPDVIAYDNLLVGQAYSFETDFNGNVISVVPAKS